MTLPPPSPPPRHLSQAPAELTKAAPTLLTGPSKPACRSHSCHGHHLWLSPSTLGSRNYRHKGGTRLRMRTVPAVTSSTLLETLSYCTFFPQMRPSRLCTQTEILQCIYCCEVSHREGEYEICLSVFR